jgi:plasmid stability protein
MPCLQKFAYDKGRFHTLSPLVSDSCLFDINGSIGYNGCMATPSEATPTASLNIRQLDPALKEQLRVRAAHHGRSMEAEARAILKEVLMEKRPVTGADLVTAIRQRFAPLGGVELKLPPRQAGREPPRFE